MFTNSKRTLQQQMILNECTACFTQNLKYYVYSGTLATNVPSTLQADLAHSPHR